MPSRQVKCVSIKGCRLGTPFTMKVPWGSKLLKAGISPAAAGEQSVWYLHNLEHEEEVEITLVVVADGQDVTHGFVQHVGMWWEGDTTFHLFECTNQNGSPLTPTPLKSDLPEDDDEHRS